MNGHSSSWSPIVRTRIGLVKRLPFHPPGVARQGNDAFLMLRFRKAENVRTKNLPATRDQSGSDGGPALRMMPCETKRCCSNGLFRRSRSLSSAVTATMTAAIASSVLEHCHLELKLLFRESRASC